MTSWSPVGAKAGAVYQGDALAVKADGAAAVYPLSIDPTFSDANWSSMGGIAGANGSVSAEVVDASGNLYLGVSSSSPVR